METASAKTGLHESPAVKTVEIPADILALIESLPDKKEKNVISWEPWQDEVLRRYWGVKTQEDISKVVGRCTQGCRRRYKELTG